MCGRYASFLPAEAMARIFGTVNPLPNLAPSWNVAPTNDLAVVRRPRRPACVTSILASDAATVG
jgi:putative SOS response-associated peptidase YedK